MKIQDTSTGFDIFDFEGMGSSRQTRTLRDSEIKEIIKEAEARGYPCTAEDILHQFNGWSRDYKTYRRISDTQEIFTPCGCNAFCLRFAVVEKPKTQWV